MTASRYLQNSYYFFQVRVETVRGVPKRKKVIDSFLLSFARANHAEKSLGKGLNEVISGHGDGVGTVLIMDGLVLPWKVRYWNNPQ